MHLIPLVFYLDSIFMKIKSNLFNFNQIKNNQGLSLYLYNNKIKIKFQIINSLRHIIDNFLLLNSKFNQKLNFLNLSWAYHIIMVTKALCDSKNWITFLYLDLNEINKKNNLMFYCRFLLKWLVFVEINFAVYSLYCCFCKVKDYYLFNQTEYILYYLLHKISIKIVQFIFL